ncbi:MAG: biopolymer transporter ExbD, partial [Acidobacteria bacterium]|nr:biopolymer transporter ExbD [Acidobacteriota bacterium]
MPKVQSVETAGPGRPGRGRRVASSLAEINVVPLVDVMLVLLIIFMVTAPMIQRGMDVKLPVARRAAQIAGERIFVTVPLAYRQSHIVYLGDEPIHAEILQERV